MSVSHDPVSTSILAWVTYVCVFVYMYSMCECVCVGVCLCVYSVHVWFNYPGRLIQAKFGCSTFLVFRWGRGL